MFCRECGTRNTDDSAFCASCGAKLLKPRSNLQSNEQQYRQSRQYPRNPEPKPNKKPLVIGVLGVFVICVIALSLLLRGGQPYEPTDEPDITESPVIEQEYEPEPEPVQETEDPPEMIAYEPEEEIEESPEETNSIIVNGIEFTNEIDIMFLSISNPDHPNHISSHSMRHHIHGRDVTVVFEDTIETPGIDMNARIIGGGDRIRIESEITYRRFYDQNVLETAWNSLNIGNKTERTYAITEDFEVNILGYTNNCDEIRAPNGELYVFIPDFNVIVGIYVYNTALEGIREHGISYSHGYSLEEQKPGFTFAYTIYEEIIIRIIRESLL